MTENLAARGEGLAAKLSAMAKYWKTNNWANDTLNDGRPSEYTCADELLAALEAAAPLSTPEPFLFAIEEPNGNWQDGESCVFSDLQSAQEEVDLLNDGYDGDGSYKVVPLYREPAGSGANSLHEAAEEILKPHWPSVRNMEENEARQKEVERIIRILRGSPRKVGEDGAQTFEQWWQAEGVHMVRTTHRTGYELMKEAWNAARSSSVPVGEQKQEEGV